MDEAGNVAEMMVLCADPTLSALSMLSLHELHDWLYHYNPTGGIPLKGTGIVVGLALILAHVWALLQEGAAKAMLKGFPRNYNWGVALLTVDLIWALLCMTYMDMGEFHTARQLFTWVIVAGYVLVLIYVREFLAVRALGGLLLFVSGIVLQAAFQQPPVSRLLLPALAYVWIMAGLYFVGMPYIMRDMVQWITAQPVRWKAACIGGVVYGLTVLMAAFLWW